MRRGPFLNVFNFFAIQLNNSTSRCKRRRFQQDSDTIVE